MKRLSIVIALSTLAAACGGTSTSPSATKPTFTADLKPSNETTTVVGPEASGSGQATITFDTSATPATATFVVTLTGFPAGTSIVAAHIHPGVAGVAGSPLLSTALVAGELVLATGSGSFTRTINAPSDVAQQIINNPSAFYFNIHTAANPGGVARGQLVRVQ
jgi:hypothetical protein